MRYRKVVEGLERSDREIEEEVLDEDNADEDQREFDFETRVITNENIIIPKMFHSCALNK